MNAEPPWLMKARRLEASKRTGTAWVYNLFDPGRHDAQVGMASDLHARLSSRWRATCKGGFVQDGIPWLNDRLVEDAAFVPTLDAHPYPDAASALAAETTLRARLRAEGWHVSSDV
jgi:hypothetical protein